MVLLPLRGMMRSLLNILPIARSQYSRSADHNWRPDGIRCTRTSLKMKRVKSENLIRMSKPFWIRSKPRGLVTKKVKECVKNA